MVKKQLATTLGTTLATTSTYIFLIDSNPLKCKNIGYKYTFLHIQPPIGTLCITKNNAKKPYFIGFIACLR